MYMTMTASVTCHSPNCIMMLLPDIHPVTSYENVSYHNIQGRLLAEIRVCIVTQVGGEYQL